MKTGETVPVTIAGQVVAQAVVKETGEGTVTLVVPATLVVMATKTEIAVETPEVDDTAPETVITGVDRVNAEGDVIETPEPVQTPPVEVEDASTTEQKNEGAETPQ